MPEEPASEYRRMYPDLPEPVYEPLRFVRYPQDEMFRQAAEWYEELSRITTRQFSAELVPRATMQGTR